MPTAMHSRCLLLVACKLCHYWLLLVRLLCMHPKLTCPKPNALRCKEQLRNVLSCVTDCSVKLHTIWSNGRALPCMSARATQDESFISTFSSLHHFATFKMRSPCIASKLIHIACHGQSAQHHGRQRAYHSLIFEQAPGQHGRDHTSVRAASARRQPLLGAKPSVWDIPAPFQQHSIPHRRADR